MKKLFLFVAAAAMFAACSETEVLDQAAQQQVSEQGGIKFDVYTQRNVTRGGGYTGDITNKTIVGKDKGFGVFAYYTASEQYSTSAKPNFMYNQKIWTDQDEATYGTLWKYEPVKYWPNEYGSAAISDDTDYVTFFAYAPWTEFEPTTGEVVPQEGKDVEKEQNYNIISVNKNNATGDPIIKYVVDTDPATSVDLLWGVAAEQAPVDYTPIDGVDGSTGANNGVTVTPGLPFLNLVKPNDPVNDKLVFNLKHALAKVRISIDYVADQVTPLEGTFADGTNWFQEYDEDGNIVSTTTAPTPLSEVINADETRIYVRSFSIEGWATEGALNLNNSEAGIPLWKDIDGVKDITFSKITYFDGLKDGKEGTDNNIQKSETPIGLNPAIIENYAQLDTIFETIPAQPAVLYADVDEYNTAKGTTLTEEEFEDLDDEAKIKTPAVEAQEIAKGFKFGSKKNAGVAAMSEALVAEAAETNATVQTPENGNGFQGSVLLFGGDPEENDGYFYVIPRNGEEDVNVYITYDVQTIDPALADKLADNLTKGSIIENNIYKEAIFGDGIDFEPGKQYDIKIHLGMTSVKIEATVTPWVENGETTVNLPNNQDPNEAEEEAVEYEYEFTSYVDAAGTEEFASGKAETTGNVKGSYQEVKVTEPATGEAYYINAAAQAADGETIYELYTYDEETETLVSAGIWVKITAKNEKE